MPYIDLAGLSRFDAAQKDALARDYALLRDMQWTRSEKAGAVSLWPVGGTPLEPVVDFLFTETPPASGDKGPDNPSTITGVSSVDGTRCGKNLERTISTNTINGVTVTNNGDGTYTANGTASANTYFVFTSSTVSCKYGEKYTVSGISGGGSSTYRLTLQCYSKQGSYINGTYIFSGSDTLTCESDGHITSALFVISGATVNNLLVKPQVELGETATSFEAPDCSDYTIDLGGTYYGGTLDVASGVMTVTWKGYVFDGTENWLANETHGTYYRYSLPITPNKNTTDIACTHFIRINNLDYEYQHYIIFASGISIFTTQATVEDFKAWLASQYAGGTPVVACYALATPYTVQLTPTEILSLTQTDKYTPRINTVYTDASAVQVGYVKSPIRDEYELQQAVIAQGGNV